MVRYTYRSTADFETEATAESGFGIKPPRAAGAATPDELSEWIDLAEQVRTEQGTTPITDRVHIGGELILTVLTNDGISIATAHRFGDYDDQWQAMNAYHQAEGDVGEPVVT